MTISISTSQAAVISGISVPDSKLANEITEFIRDTESTLLFNHSSRVYYFGALAGQRRGLKFDAELLYAGPMFHDIGLVPAYSSAADRFEVDGANAARDFLRHRLNRLTALHSQTPSSPNHRPGSSRHRRHSRCHRRCPASSAAVSPSAAR
jgi:hypothetical protein